MSKYVFETVDKLVEYLISKKPDITPLRLQKSLYFLYGYYGATYGQMNTNNISEGEFEGSYDYPEELFPAEFQAWKFGPVIKDVYHRFANQDFNGKDWKPEEEAMKNIKLFIDDLLKQLAAIGDFGLVERSHMDNAWQDVYEEGAHNIEMNNNSIIEEYVERYV